MKDFIQPPPPSNTQKEKPKEYPISDDIALLYDKSKAADKIRDLAIKLPFGYRKARKAASDSVYFNRIFWKRIMEVYPELIGKGLTYRPFLQIVVETKEGE